MRSWLRGLSFFLLIVIIISTSFYFRDQFTQDSIQQHLIAYGAWAWIVFFVLYVIATIAFLPGSIMTLVGGFLFGPVIGGVLNLTAATVGATAAFLIARYVARDWVQRKGGKIVTKLNRGIEREGWRFVMVVRLAPIFPFNLVNYAMGLTKISLLDFVWASFVFMAPGCFVYTYIGSLGQTALAGDIRLFLTRALIAVGIFVVLLTLPYFVKRWHDENK